MIAILFITASVVTIVALVLGSHAGASGMKRRCMRVFYMALRESSLPPEQRVEVMNNVEKDLDN